MTIDDWSAALLLALAAVLPLSIAMTNVLLAALSALAFARLLRSPSSWESEWNPALFALTAYAAAGLLAAALGLEPLAGLRQAAKDWHRPWTLATLLLALRGKPRGRQAAFAAAGYSAAALIGIYQWATQVHIGKQYIVYHPRAHAFVHPVTFGELFAFGVLGGLCFWGREEAGGAKPSAKAMTACFLALGAAALALNQTRGALAGLAVGFAAVCALDGKLRRWALPLAGVVLAMGLASQVVHTGGRSVAVLLRLADSGRSVLWRVAWEIFRDHPWHGVGPGNYATVFSNYFKGSLEEQASWGSAHNLYLHQAAERGLLGLAALACALGTLTARAFRRARANPNAWNLWAWGAMAGFLVMNLTEVAFQNELVCVTVLFIWCWAETNREVPAVKTA